MPQKQETSKAKDSFSGIDTTKLTESQKDLLRTMQRDSLPITRENWLASMAGDYWYTGEMDAEGMLMLLSELPRELLTQEDRERLGLGEDD